MLLSGRIYLSTIYRLKKKGGRVRSVELARELGYTKPSISRAIAGFEKDGYLTVEKGGILELTDLGQKTAKDLVRRQDMIAEFLQMTCGIGADQARKDAIGMEPSMSKKTMQGMKAFIREVNELQSSEG